MLRPRLRDRSRLRRSLRGIEQLEDRRVLSTDPLLDPFEYGETAEVGYATAAATSSSFTVQNLNSISISGNTEHKPQSKVWFHDSRWWAVLPNSSGTWIWRLNQSNLSWDAVLKVAPGRYNGDVRAVGNEAHILLYDNANGPASKLVSVTYDSNAKTYGLWGGGTTPNLVDLSLHSAVETATLDVDTTGRLWIVYDGNTTIEARYSDYNNNSSKSSPYSTISSPITIASGIGTDDISAVMALPAGTKLSNGTPISGGGIGVIWSNQETDDFGFRIHVDGNAPNVWSTEEIPASQSSASNLADDHLNVAVASDGTIYVAAKTSFNTSTKPTIILMVRRANGQWDPLYDVAHHGTRPIVVLNEAQNRVLVLYDESGIRYRESSASTISFGAEQSIINGSNVTSTKQNWSNELVIIAGGKGVLLTSGAISNQPPVVSAGPDQNVSVAGAVNLDGNVIDDGSFTTTWTKRSGPGTVTFGSASAIDTTATFGASGTYVLRLTASDGEYTVFDEVTIIYNPAAPAPPVAVNDEYSVIRNNPLVVSAAAGVLANDSDPNGDPITAVLASGPSSGSLTLSSNGSFTYTPNSGFTGVDSFTYRANDGSANSPVATVTINVNEVPAGPTLRTGVVSGVTNTGWTTVTLDRAYASMVVVLTPHYPSSGVPVVARVRNATGNSFEVRLDRRDGSTQAIAGLSLHYVVVEEGVYTVAQHGVKMEAVKFTSTLTDNRNSWVGQNRSYGNSYSSPVVIGQVMTYNDPKSSVFWARGNSSTNPPSSSALFVGKQVGEDPSTARANETIGYIVIESGTGNMEGVSYIAGLGADIVKGIEDSPPYTYSLGSFSSPITAVLSSAAMDGVDGGWPVLYGSNPVTSSGLKLAMDEDTLGDSERKHSDEQVAFLVFNGTTAPSNNGAPLAGNDSYSVNEDQILTVTAPGVLANDSDPNSDPITAVLVAGPSSGSLTLNANGSFTYTPNANFNSTDSFTYRANDGSTSSAIATVTITVNPVNDPPVAAADTYSTVAGNAISPTAATGVLANDTDVDGDSLTAQLVAGPSSGSLTLNTNGSFTYTPNSGFTGTDSFTYRANDGTSNSAIATVTINVNELAAGPMLRTGIVSGVTNTGWTTVTLDRSYASMVVVLTPHYPSSGVPVVPRVRNATGSSFEVRLDRRDGSTQAMAGLSLHYVVVEEGVYTVAEHGVKMEAVKYTSTVTDSKSSWVGQNRSYGNSYSSPVVIGQVMTYNDPKSSVFWARGNSSTNPPSSSALFVGKHVGEDPSTARANETIGYLVIEAGTGSLEGVGYIAGLGADIVKGIEDSPPYTYSLNGFSSPVTAVLSSAAMDGPDGAWPVLYGSDPVTSSGLKLAMDEDTLGDSERKHQDEQVAFLVFNGSVAGSNSPPVAVEDSFQATQEGTLDVNGVLDNDWDPDDDPLTAVLVAGPSNGTLNLRADGTFTYTPNSGFSGTDSFTYRASDGTNLSAVTTVSINVNPITAGPQLRTGLITGVTNTGWTTVTLDRSYASMVVALTPHYPGYGPPLVARVRNASGNSFEVRLDRADGSTQPIAGLNVHYVVVEEGVYTVAEHGVKMEAVKFNSTVTDSSGSWASESRSYANSYSSPVVIGQVMTYNDPDFTVFWARGNRRENVPSSTSLFVGKHVGEDSDTSRANETIGYLVIESGAGSIGGVGFLAGVGADTVRGVDDGPPYGYSLGGLASPGTAILSQSAMDGENGSWAVLYGPDPVSSSGLKLAVDEDKLKDAEREHTTEQVSFLVFSAPGGVTVNSQQGAEFVADPVVARPELRTGVVSGVTNTGWTKVTLDRSYASMVVSLTPHYPDYGPPLVPRVRNATGNSFEVRLDRADGSTAPIAGLNVHYVVVEEGVYTQDLHGVKMEAVKFNSSVTDGSGSWAGESRSYSNSYSSPVVVGQVMSYNDSRFSMFWTRGDRIGDAPSASALYVGKHVGEDPSASRANETIGYIVIEAGLGSIGGIGFLAGVGEDAVRGIDNGAHSYSLSGLSAPRTAILSQAAMGGDNGSWAVLYGPDPVTATRLRLTLDEDQLKDVERLHAPEPVAFLIFDGPAGP